MDEKSNIQVGDRVRLLPGFDEVYPRAVVGSQGTVVDEKIDRYGFEKVYVEWDKEHWTFNGEDDGWTFASHFEIIDAPEVTQEPRTDLCPHCGEVHSPEQDAYMEALSQAFEMLAEGEAFLVIGVSSEPTGQEGVRILGTDLMTASQNNESSTVLEQALMQVHSLLLQGTKLTDLRHKREEE